MNNAKLITAFTAIQQLASVTRYSKDKIVNRESVLEHTGFVAFFAYVLGQHLSEYHDEHEIDFGLLLSRAVVHDWDEIFVGDIPRITKYASPEILNEFKTLELESIRKLSVMLGLPTQNLIDHWSLSKDEDDVEGLVVRIADLIAVVYKCWQEIELFGNYSIVRIVFELRGQVMPKVRDKIANAAFLHASSRAYLLTLMLTCNELMFKLEMACNRVSTDARDALVTFNVVKGEPT